MKLLKFTLPNILLWICFIPASADMLQILPDYIPLDQISWNNFCNEYLINNQEPKRSAILTHLRNKSSEYQYKQSQFKREQRKCSDTACTNKLHNQLRYISRRLNQLEETRAYVNNNFIRPTPYYKIKKARELLGCTTPNQD